ncbi:MAG: hypothetical protein EBR82_69290 [Caulobacteraceae bacterium]|nr:hypothetical protein [Caulobacteraceae bacterium]
MTNEDYSKVPPPHLLKKFSEQARVDSQKRGHPGYCKTFAKLCIDWAFRELAMDDYRAASAEVSAAASQPGSSSEIERRSDIVPPPNLVLQWMDEFNDPQHAHWEEYEVGIATRAAQWSADIELEACLEWLEQNQGRWEIPMALRDARRPKPPSFKRVALLQLDTLNADLGLEGKGIDLSQIRRALEQLDD